MLSTRFVVARRWLSSNGLLLQRTTDPEQLLLFANTEQDSLFIRPFAGIHRTVIQYPVDNLFRASSLRGFSHKKINTKQEWWRRQKTKGTSHSRVNIQLELVIFIFSWIHIRYARYYWSIPQSLLSSPSVRGDRIWATPCTIEDENTTSLSQIFNHISYRDWDNDRFLDPDIN